MKVNFKIFPIFIVGLVISLQINAQCLCTFITTFNASRTSCTTNLSWTTGTETAPNATFKIWRSLDAKNWIQIASVTATGSPHTYSYADPNPYNPSHGTVYYQIYYINTDGTTTQVTTVSTVSYSGTTCTGSLGSLCGTPAISGFTTPFLQNQTETLSISGAAAQTISWSISNSNVASISPTGYENSQGLLKAVTNSGSASLTATLQVCGTTASKGILVGNAPLINGYPSYYFSVTQSTGAGNILAAPGATVHVVIAASGPPPSTYTTYFNISGATLSNGATSASASNGSITYTFTMPLSGSVNWSGSFSEPNSDGSGSVSVN